MNYDFSFVTNDNTRKALQIMQEVLNDYNLWTYLNSFSEDSFCFSNSKELDMIANDPRNNFHSGASFALTMRSMKYIIDNGIDEYKNFIMYEELSQKNFPNKIKNDFVLKNYYDNINNCLNLP
jgi:hypothetical protein